MKKLIVASVTALSLCSYLSVSAAAETTDTASVLVTIADENGALALAAESVTVTDTDADGALTIRDALYCAHEAYYPGGAAAGFSSSEGTYGLQLDLLWGAGDGISYGYYVNHTAAMSLGDPVADGDIVAAFVYTDLTAWSDTYCWFDSDSLEMDTNDTVTLTLTAAGYDASWNPVTLPVADAVLTIDGMTSEYTTDENGTVTLTMDTVGSFVISAVSDTQILVPPVCRITVNEAEQTAPSDTEPTESTTTTTTAAATTTQQTTTPNTGDNSITVPLFAAAALFGTALLTKKKTNAER